MRARPPSPAEIRETLVKMWTDIFARELRDETSRPAEQKRPAAEPDEPSDDR